MIYTVTFNPSIDYVMHVDRLHKGEINRSVWEGTYLGGKGINVSLVLKELDVPSVALGFLGGYTGEYIRKQLKVNEIESEMIWLKEGESRINVKIRENRETDINAGGPLIGDDAIEQLKSRLNRLVDGDMLVLAGSIPPSLPDTIYEELLAIVSEKKIQTVVDACGPLLKKLLNYHPFLIKPNHHELAEIFDTTDTSAQNIVSMGKRLIEAGARNVLVSRGSKGAILICEDGRVFRHNAPSGVVLNTVGSGDAMVAGFIAGYIQEKDVETGLKMGIATGSATAFSENMAKREKISSILGKINR